MMLSRVSMYDAPPTYLDSHHFCHSEPGSDFVESWTPDLDVDGGPLSLVENGGCSSSTRDENDPSPIEKDGTVSVLSAKSSAHKRGVSITDPVEESLHSSSAVVSRMRSNSSPLPFKSRQDAISNSGIPGLEWADEWADDSFAPEPNAQADIVRSEISETVHAFKTENEGGAEELAHSALSAPAIDESISSRRSGPISSCGMSLTSVPVNLVRSYAEAQPEGFPVDACVGGGELRQHRQVERPHQEKPQPQQQWQVHHQQQPDYVEPELWLVQALYFCAECILNRDRERASEWVRRINQYLGGNKSLRGPMVRVAGYFAEALTERIFGAISLRQEDLLKAYGYTTETIAELLHKTFYETSPMLKFVHFTANQAILDGFKGATRVHIIDFNLNYGLQWPVVIEALSRRPGGPPALRLTGLGPRAGTGGEGALNAIGGELYELAKKFNLKFEFEAIAFDKLSEIKPWTFTRRPGEVTGVNSMLQLHQLLQSESSNDEDIDDVLRTVRSLTPKVFMISEQDANHNVSNFRERFVDALHYYAAVFDSLEALKLPPNSYNLGLTEMYFGREIRNIVACEDAQRIERHEFFCQWQMRLRNAGFQQVPLSRAALSQAQLILRMYKGDGYRIQHLEDALTLCWENRPLITTSVWECAAV